VIMVSLDEQHLCTELVHKAGGRPELLVGSLVPLVVIGDAGRMVNPSLLYRWVTRCFWGEAWLQ